MKAVLIGDACSGKTTVLKLLHEKGYPVIFEEGWQNLPPEIEQDKL